MKSAISVVHRTLNVLLALLLALLIVPVSLQIFARFTDLIPAYIWTEEMARFCLVWMIMIGAMTGLREGSHFSVDLFQGVDPRLDAALRLVSLTLILVFALIFLVWGYDFVAFGWYQTSELAELPMWMIFIAWPLTGLAWIVFAIEKILDTAARLRTESKR
jgi:TRAP-type C4-dicarboxylate transport system permease small subunit